MSEAIDNSDQIALLMANGDPDAFYYTEILDRSRRSAGDNRKRVVRSYRHRHGADLLTVMPQIRDLCEATGARAYTRLSPRSHKAVAKELLRLTAEMVVAEQWNSASYLYSRACGRTNIHDRRTWLYDVDEPTGAARELGELLCANGHLLATIPSRKGWHYIARPHDPREDAPFMNSVGGAASLHKDNPTNLFIPKRQSDL